MDEAFNLIADNLFDLYIPDFTVNLSEFFGYTMQSSNLPMQRVVLKLVHALWSSAKLKLGHLEDYMTCSLLLPLRSFVRKLPFSQENIGSIRDLALFVLNDEVPLSSPGTSVVLNQVNQVDIFSQGRAELFAEYEIAPGSIR